MAARWTKCFAGLQWFTLAVLLGGLRQVFSAALGKGAGTATRSQPADASSAGPGLADDVRDVLSALLDAADFTEDIQGQGHTQDSKALSGKRASRIDEWLADQTTPGRLLAMLLCMAGLNVLHVWLFTMLGERRRSAWDVQTPMPVPLLDMLNEQWSPTRLVRQYLPRAYCFQSGRSGV